MTNSIDTQLENGASASFQEFVKLCEAHDLLSRPSGLAANDVNDGLNDPVTLLRFFNARGGDVQGALEQFREAERIRTSLGHLATYEHMEVQDYEATRKLYPHWSGCRTKRGLPICVFDVTHLHPAALNEFKRTRAMPVCPEHVSETREAKPNSVQRALAFHETLTRFVLPLCSAMPDRLDPDTPVSSALYLVDISGLGIKQALQLRNYAQDISSLLATSFPEVVDSIYICNAPSYFGTIWNFAKKWLDPRTASKLVILTKDEMMPTLTSLIDLDNIPEELGGRFSFKLGMAPTVDAGIVRQLEWISQPEGQLPEGPLKWTTDDQDRRTAVAVGSLDGQPRNHPVAILKP